jgi:hypothetical protein
MDAPMPYEIFGRHPNGTLTPRQGYYTPPPQTSEVDPRIFIGVAVGALAMAVWSNHKAIAKEGRIRAERLRKQLRGW